MCQEEPVLRDLVPRRESRDIPAGNPALGRIVRVQREPQRRLEARKVSHQAIERVRVVVQVVVHYLRRRAHDSNYARCLEADS